ncbi:TetR family transcriptional regulator [Aquimarina atlantica]|uniref:TetR family transcriptional regulator n=1 Tax=Aquimarina atlantica TaxID=1317122 RepID=A0A023BQA7_9FLAO|nr:TetR/AcrR family transcriptional regulator [Aquimarina atlantica]EZH71878.1 TetR family transcriptional regulator [Aquimarina atlantica]
MRPQKVNDQDLLEGLMSVIRSKGYDGSSLNELAGSSGLQKASLYHRFPNGKKEITAVVLDYVEKWVTDNILSLLSDTNIPPSERLEKALINIDDLYGGGQKTCILRALTMDSNLELFGEQLSQIMSQWITGFNTLGVAFGLSESDAKSKAEQTLILIQGSLIVSKALSDLSPFQKTLASIKAMYS